MVVKGDVRASSVRTVWESPPFMTESWMMGDDVFLPVNFDRDFATVMEVYRKSQPAPAK
jgi:hypothetical protein